MQDSMETQSESIDIASIRYAALGTLEASQGATFEHGVSGNDRLEAIQRAFQRSIAAATTSQHNATEELAAGVHPAKHAADQNTFPELASTVPDSQVPLDVSNSLSHSLHAVQPYINDLVGKMSTQGSLPQDTQPVSQSIYESIINQAKNIRRPDQANQGVDYGADTRNVDNFLQEGDEGHIDLFSNYNVQGQEMDDGSDSESAEFSPTQSQNRLSQFPESQRFKTPGTASRKRKHSGETVETSSLRQNPLARNGGPTPGKMMGLSQAFANTQAASSPCLTVLQSEPRSDRPSPNIELEPRPATAPLSSPLQSRSDFKRTTTEPYSHYKSIRQSQAERERLALLRHSDGADRSGSISDEDFDDEPSLVERRKRQRERDEKVREQFQAITSATRPRSRGTVGPFSSPVRGPRPSSHRTSPQQHSPWSRNTVQLQIGLATCAQHDEPIHGATGSLHESEEETEQEDEAQIAVKRSSQAVAQSEEDKENVVFEGDEVPETVVPFHRARPPRKSVDESPSVRHSAGKSHSSVRSPEPDANERFAVADSQSSQSARRAPQQARNPLALSEEGPSFVPQSQLLPNGIHTPSSAPRHDNGNPFEETREAEIAGVADGDHIVIQRTSSGEEGAVDDGAASLQSPRQISDEVAMTETVGLVATARRFATRKLPASESTIPETSSLSRKESEITSSSTQPARSKPSVFLGEGPFRCSTEFETAQTQFSKSEDVIPSLPPQLSSIVASPSGRKRRMMTDIAADPSPRMSGSDIDLDAAMAIVDNEEFDNLVGSSSPIPPGRQFKRRCLNENRRATSFPDHLPAVTEEQEQTTLASAPDQFGASQNGVLPEQPDHQTHRSPSYGDASVPPVLRTKGGKGNLATPARKLAFGNPRAHNARASERLWDVQASPEKPPAPKPKKQGAKTQKPPSTTPVGKVQTQGSTIMSGDTLQVKKSCKRSLRGSNKAGKEYLDALADGTLDNSVVAPEPPLGDIVAPNQVLACFNGKTRAYYPARCVGITGAKSLHYLIQWEGFEPDEIDAYGVRRLDLRVGDVIKVNLDDFPKVSHVICGFKDKIISSATNSLMTDIRGHKTLVVVPKQRKSLPTDLRTENGKEVPVGSIYLDSNMWSQMKGREFGYTEREPQSHTGFATPTEYPSTPTTPTSRSRRNAALGASTAAVQPIGIFTNMAFAISYDDAQRKSSLTHLINTNGGTVVLDGFTELFAHESMSLSPKYANLGFTALLADRHSRKAKYMQALALNLPCLSGKWIETCIGKESIVNWQPYLLPAGDSIVLDGATRSRVLPAFFDPTSAKLAGMIVSRPNLLSNDAVVLVTGRGKAEEKRKAVCFLAQAAGAGRVQKVTDFKTAISQGSQNEDVKWILVEDRDVGTAKKMLEQRGVGTNRVPSAVAATEGVLKVVGNEFICQSLILGALIEE